MKTYLDPKRKPYIHLIDGGVSDNLGVRGFLESLIARGGIREAMREANLEKTRRVAVIIVDAQTQETAGWQVLDEVPGLTTVLGASSTIMINKYNFETIEFLHHVARDWAYDDKMHGEKPIDFYIVHVAFDALPDEKERDYFNSVPTSFYLEEEQVDRLREVAAKLLYTDKDFQRLVKDLGGRMPEVKARKVGEFKTEAQPQTAGQDIDGEFHALP
jgi:NTE family protein